MPREVPDEPSPEFVKCEFLLFSGQVHLFRVATPSYKGAQESKYLGLQHLWRQAGSETPRMRNGRPSPEERFSGAQEEQQMPTRTHVSDCLAAR